MFYLNEDVLCVRYDRVVEEHESRTKVNSLGKIKAKVDPQLGSVNVYFHAADTDIISRSTVLIWMQANGTRIALTPTLEIYNENHRLMRLKASVIHSKAHQQFKYNPEEIYDLA